MVWTSKRKSVWAQMVIYSSSLYKSGRGQPINRCIWVRNTSSQHAQMWTPIFHLKTELLHNSRWPSPVITNLFTLGFWKSLANTWLLLAERLFFQSSFMTQEYLSSGFGVFFFIIFKYHHSTFETTPWKVRIWDTFPIWAHPGTSFFPGCLHLHYN